VVSNVILPTIRGDFIFVIVCKLISFGRIEKEKKRIAKKGKHEGVRVGDNGSSSVNA
jgi:hypothetical protein